MQPIAPPSPDYIPGPEEPQAPLPPDFVPEPEYPEFLVSSDAKAPIEEQPYTADASPTALSLGYVTDSDLEEDPEEDPEEEHVDYPTDGGDDDDKPSDKDDDDNDDNDDGDSDDEDKETSEDEEEEEHLAPADPSTVPVVDPVPSAEDTEEVEAEEPAPTSPRTRVPFSQTRLRKAQKTVRLEPPMSPSMVARMAEYAALPTPPLPPLSPLLPWEDILEDKLPPRKRLYSTAPTSRYEVGESSTAAPRLTRGHRDQQTQIFKSVEALVDDRQYHYETAQLLDQEALVSREAWAHSVGLSSAAHYEL
ncbi:hypothetical protein Tco_0933217 [Tanacetum coccineum]